VTSPRKIKANRANARASTGPKTAHGRARAARNGLRHGLSVPVFSDPVFSEEVDALARAMAGPDAGAAVLELARRVAEAEIDLRRVRDARHQLLNRALRDPDYESEARVREKDALVGRCARVDGPVTPMPYDVVAFLDSKPEGPVKLAMILADKARELRALDRYERRALSRRKFAIRAYDMSCKILWELSKVDR
jgi:hypothetical protein